MNSTETMEPKTLTDNAPNQIIVRYEMRYGRGVKLYTLWRITQSNRFYNERYVRNLGADYQESVTKAQAVAGQMNRELTIDAPEDLLDIRYGEDVIRWGKYRDTHVKDIPDQKYIIWLWKGAYLKNKEGEWEEKLYKGSPIRLAAEKVLLEQGVLVEYNDRLVTVERAEELRRKDELNAHSEYVGEVGQKKVHFDLTIEDVKSIETQFGHIDIFLMRDEQGNMVVYKGKLRRSQLYRDTLSGKTYSSSDPIWKDLHNIGISNGRFHTCNYDLPSELGEYLNSLSFPNDYRASYIGKDKTLYYMECIDERTWWTKGDTISLTATIKDHTEYNGTKQTIIERPKIQEP